MTALAESIGRPAAQAAVRAATEHARNSGGTLAGALAADPIVTAHVPPERLRILLDPANAIGTAGALIDAALAAWAD
jgi:3-carboxy-cis,cis-muconate cycloisomerase